MQKVMTVRRTRWISGVLLTGVAFAPTPVVLAVDAPADVANLQSSLANPTATAADREEFARRLVDRDSAEARSQVRTDLQNGSEPIRIALANAIATATNPDPALIPILGKLLTAKADVSKAAATALVNFQDHPEVNDLLTGFAGNASNGDGPRSEVIGAMGSLVNQDVARFLMQRLQDPQDAGVHRAAADALGAMTGLDYGLNAAAWQRWWQTASVQNSDHFVAEALKARARKVAALQQRLSRLSRDSKSLLQSSYLRNRDAQPDEADAILMTYLISPSPEIRELGASLAYSALGSPPSDKVKSRLRTMIGDSDAGVRQNVVNALLAANDQQAIVPLLAQLDVERDPAIKVRIVQALGKTEDTRVVPALLKLVQGNDTDVAILAANEIAGPLGTKYHQADAASAAKASTELRTLVDKIADIPAHNKLRAACLAALAALRDPKSEATFLKFLIPGDTAEVRCAAINGLGNLGDSNVEDQVAQQLDGPELSVKLAAANALLNLATPTTANTLASRIKTEPDREVQDALRRAFKGLFDKFSESELKKYAEQFKDDSQMRLDILVALADTMEKEHKDDDVAINNLDIADVYMKLPTPQPLDAISRLQKSLDYLQQRGPVDVNLNSAISQMMSTKIAAARLGAATYADAVDFAAKQMATNPKAYGGVLIGPLVHEADELATHPRTPKDTENAGMIVKKTLDIPNLGDQNINSLKDIQRTIDAANPPH